MSKYDKENKKLVDAWKLTDNLNVKRKLESNIIMIDMEMAHGRV